MEENLKLENQNFLKQVVYKLPMKSYSLKEAEQQLFNEDYQSFNNLSYYDLINKQRFVISRIEIIPRWDRESSQYTYHRRQGVSINSLHNFFKEEEWKIVCIINEELMHYKHLNEVLYYLEMENMI